MPTTARHEKGVMVVTFQVAASLARPSGSTVFPYTTLFRSANKACEGDPVASDGPVSVSGDGDYETPAGAAPAAAGTYYWVAGYSGDANNEGVSRIGRAHV